MEASGGTGFDYRLSGQNLRVSAAGQDVGHEKTSSGAKRKSPRTAGLLGGLLGYGSGQYYCRKPISGTAFLVLDALSTFLLAAGIAVVTSDSGSTSVAGISESTLTGTLCVSFGAVGLLGSHVAQAILGPRCARKHNQQLSGAKAGNRAPLVFPGVDSVAIGFSFGF